MLSPTQEGGQYGREYRIKPTDIMKFYDMLENDTQIRRLKKEEKTLIG